MRRKQQLTTLLAASSFLFLPCCGDSGSGNGTTSCESLCKCMGAECVSGCGDLKAASVYTDDFYSHLDQCISSVDCNDEDFITLQESCLVLYLEALPASQCESDMIEARCTIPCLGLSAAEQEECRLYFTDTLIEARGFTSGWCADGVACLDTYDCSDPGGDPIANCGYFGNYEYTFFYL